MCPTNATALPPTVMDDVAIAEASMLVASTLVASKDALTTVKFVNVPESAVKVEAET